MPSVFALRRNILQEVFDHLGHMGAGGVAPGDQVAAAVAVEHAVFVLCLDVLFLDVAYIVATTARETAFAVNVVTLPVAVALFCSLCPAPVFYFCFSQPAPAAGERIGRTIPSALAGMCKERENEQDRI